MIDFKNIVKNNIFTVSFIKKDGEERILNGSFNIYSRLKKDSLVNIPIHDKFYIDILNQGILAGELLSVLKRQSPEIKNSIENNFSIEVIEPDVKWVKDINKTFYLLVENRDKNLTFNLCRKATVDPNKYLVVLDHKINEIRAVNKDTIKWVKCSGYIWVRKQNGQFKCQKVKK